MRFLCLTLLPGLTALPAHAQAPNDDIEHRRLLVLEEIVASNTTGCTVQWACVDERLTGKCGWQVAASRAWAHPLPTGCCCP